MLIAAVTVPVLLISASIAAGSPGQPARDAFCKQWRECQQLALAAAERGEYETFHDLAWRAAQTGPRNDPSLMYLLARAQALSGRAHDALVMLQRLADMGVPSDAATNDDFSRTRQLPGWADLAARIERLARPEGRALQKPDSPPGATPAPAAAAAPASPAAAPPAAAPPTPVVPPTPSAADLFAPAPAAEAARFSTGPLAMRGFAYDVVSGRFLFGDRLGRKLIVVDERSHSAVDLVRAESAGFDDIAAIEIDERRGDLWVASAASADGAGTLHKLQLVSGRPLKAFRIDPGDEPVKPVDLAVTPAGAVLVLDAANRRLLVLHAGAAAVESMLRIRAGDPVSLTAGGDERTAYIAHRDGVSRIDLHGRTISRIKAPKGISLARLERIRWHRNALIALAPDGGGMRRIVRLDLNADGTAVTQATTIESSVSTAGEAAVTISGDDLLYLVASRSQTATSQDPSAKSAELVAYRVRLR